MKKICAVLICCFVVPVSIAADQVSTVTGTELQDPRTRGDLNSFLIDQFKERALSAEERKQQEYLDLWKRYPDVVPERRLQEGYASGLSQLVYDANFANTIFFSSGSSFLTDVQSLKLSSIVEAMIEEPGFNLVIVGHSSFNTHIEDGEQRLYFNRWISGRRAVKVWDYFVRRGIDEKRLAAFAKDSQDPLNGEDSLAEENFNRRVEMRLTNQLIPVGSGDLVTRKSVPKQQGSTNSTQPN